MIQNQLIKFGIATYFMTVNTDLGAAPEQKQEIAKEMPTQIGRIYGLSLYTDNRTPANKQQISINDAMNMYLTLKWGASDFIASIRLDTLIYDTIPFTTSLLPGERFLPVNVPNDFSLDQSYYENPTLTGTNKTVSLNLWYISEVSWQQLKRAGMVDLLFNPPAH